MIMGSADSAGGASRVSNACGASGIGGADSASGAGGDGGANSAGSASGNSSAGGIGSVGNSGVGKVSSGCGCGANGIDGADSASGARYKVIACEILSRELFYCASLSDNIIDISFLPKGFHDIGSQNMRERIQAEIDAVDAEKYAAIILGFGLCNNGIVGLRSKLPLVAPKAHDCITLLMGSREMYASYFENNPGTFFKSPGWLERDANPNGAEGGIMQMLGMNIEDSGFLNECDEETAAFLRESLGDWMRNYKKIAYIDTGVGNPGKNADMARQQAQSRGFEFETVAGNLKLLADLLNGEWNENYLVVAPGDEIANSYDSEIVKSGSGEAHSA
jgi:hypothetical protein